MVVGLVPVLVVRRVEVREVERAEGRDQLDGIAAYRVPGTVEQVGSAQGQPLVGPRGPFLQVRHLHPGRGVDPVGGLDEAREQDRIVRVIAPGVDGISDRVDTGTVLGSEEASVLAEGLRHVARFGRERIERGEFGVERVTVDGASVGGDRRLAEHVGVAGPVDSSDETATAFEFLRDPRGSGEEIERAATTGHREECAQHSDEASLGPQILDRHASTTVVARPT